MREDASVCPEGLCGQGWDVDVATLGEAGQSPVNHAAGWFPGGQKGEMPVLAQPACWGWDAKQRWLRAGNAREGGPALGVQNEGSDFLSALH